MCSCKIYAWTLSIYKKVWTRYGRQLLYLVFCRHVFEINFGGNDNGLEFFVLYEQCFTWSRTGNGCIFSLTGKWNE